MIEERDRANSFDHHGSTVPATKNPQFPIPRFVGPTAPKLNRGGGLGVGDGDPAHPARLRQGTTRLLFPFHCKSVRDSHTRLHCLIGQKIAVFRARGSFSDWRSSVFNPPTYIIYVQQTHHTKEMRSDKYLRAHLPKEYSGWEDNAVRDRRACGENLCSFSGGVIENVDYSSARVDIAR